MNWQEAALELGAYIQELTWAGARGCGNIAALIGPLVEAAQEGREPEAEERIAYANLLQEALGLLKEVEPNSLYICDQHPFAQVVKDDLGEWVCTVCGEPAEETKISRELSAGVRQLIGLVDFILDGLWLMFIR